MRGPGLHLILLSLHAWAASAALQTDVIKSTIMTGENRFQCSFTIVLLPSNKVNLKKSKVVCNPRKPKRQKANNVKLVGKLRTYLVSLTINPTKIKKVEVQEEPSTTETTTVDKSTSTIDPGSGTESGTCHVGFTSICEVDKTNGCPSGMYKLCPNKEDNEKEIERATGCSCLPTLLVQQAVKAGISPLGCGRGCVCVKGGMEHCGLTTTDPIEMSTKSSVVPTLAEEKKLIYFGPGRSVYFPIGQNLVLTYPDLKPANCSVPQHPSNEHYREGYVGTMTKWGTMVCGGYSQLDITRGQSCYTYRHGVWKPSNQMFTARDMAAAAWISTPMGSRLWWVTGGTDGAFGSESVISTELYDPNTQQWTSGVDLPIRMSRHCMVAINTTHVFIVGGEDYACMMSIDYECSRAYMYSMASGFEELPGTTLWNMNSDQSTGRCSCEVLGQNVWVVGNVNQPQYYNLISQTWGDGPTPPTLPYWSTGLLTLVDDKLICLIGYEIYKMDNGVWTLVGEIADRGVCSMAIIWGHEECVDTGSSTTKV